MTSRLELSRPALLDALALLIASAASILLVARSALVTPALILLAVALILQLARHRLLLRRIPLQVPLLIFLFSALFGMNLSSDPDASWAKFWLMVASVILFYVIATLETAWVKLALVWGVLIFAVGVSLFFVTQHNFTDDPAKVSIINSIGLVTNRLDPRIASHVPHPNLIADILAIGLIFGGALAYYLVRSKSILALVIDGVLLAVIALGFLLTTSRGGWAALFLVLVFGAIIYAAARAIRRFKVSRGIVAAVLINAFLVLLVLGTLFGGASLINQIIALMGPVGGVPRPEIIREAFQLGQDVPFTGIGLDVFTLNFSSYVLLSDNAFLPHAHNLYVQVFVEQGIIGAVAFLWFIFAYYLWSLQQRLRLNWLAWAGIAATSLILIHGFVDVIFYFSRMIPLMFVPLGLTVAAVNPMRIETEPRKSFLSRPVLIGAGITAALALLLAGFFGLRRDALTAQWYANLGALRQAQIELAGYDYPTVTPPKVRRTADLSSAQDLFNKALEIDPTNRVANARLGFILLARDEYTQAAEYLQAAYDSDPANRAVLKALGFADVYIGKPDDAEKLLRQIPEAVIELKYQRSDWDQRKNPDRAAQAAAILSRLAIPQ